MKFVIPRCVTQHFIPLLTLCWLSASLAQPAIQPNDNVQPAGTLTDNRLSVDLVAETGTWYPGGEGTHGIEVQAFREAGSPLQIPGPLIRVEEGTLVDATLHNNIPGSTLRVNGMHSHPATGETSTLIPYGETREISFMAGDPGVYFYYGSTVARVPGQRIGVDSQLSGAFVVDRRGSRPDDRIIVLNEYLRGLPPNGVSGAQTAFNGISWTGEQVVEVEVGKTNRWHIVNTTFGGHPIHLHGQHFRVMAKGDQAEYNEIVPADRSEVVTTAVPSYGVHSIEWQAVAEGNWLFHCHISAHVGSAQLSWLGDTDIRELQAQDFPDGMGGMMMGIRARRGDGPMTTPAAEREVTMLLEPDGRDFGGKPGYRISLQEGEKSLAANVTPGPALHLQRGQPVAINIVNRLDHPTAIHWHGMELQSYYDGVAGFSGQRGSVTPLIQPGESFRALMTPPRAGTYFYHSHYRDTEQLGSGLYGAMIVSAPDSPYDAEHDRSFVIGLIGEGGPAGLRLDGPHIGINGKTDFEDSFRVGREYRLRIVNITANNGGFAVWLNSPRGPENWTIVAKDGAELPEQLRETRTASLQQVSVGEAYDFSWQPTQPGSYWLEVRRGGNGEFMGQARLNVTP